MPIKTLGERLQTQFGGKIESEYGTPVDDELRADLTRVRENPQKDAFDTLMISYFGQYGFRHMTEMTETELAFEHAQHGLRVVTGSYHPGIQKLIVSASRF